MLRAPIESTQFASWAFTERAKASGLVPSMGSVGDCYDNAMIEAFWSRMQVKAEAFSAAETVAALQRAG
ncbi:hypothetical protein ACFSIL_28035, partial [Streptosporangium lutulentum]